MANYFSCVIFLQFLMCGNSIVHAMSNISLTLGGDLQ